MHYPTGSENLLVQGNVEVVLKEHNGYKIRFDNPLVQQRIGTGESIFVPDQSVMSDGPVPLLTVDKPDFEDGVETSKDSMYLIDALAELQGTLDEKEKIVMTLRENNNDAQKQFACGFQLSTPSKTEYAQNLVELNNVNNSIEKLFLMISKYSSGLTQKYPFELDTSENALSNATDLVEHEIKRQRAIRRESVAEPVESEYLIIHLVAILEELSKSGDFNDQLIAELLEKAKEVVSPDLHSLFEQEVVQQVKHLRRTLETNFLDSFTGH